MSSDMISTMFGVSAARALLVPHSNSKIRSGLILCRIFIFPFVTFRGTKGDYLVLQALLRFHGNHLGGQCVEVDLALEARHTIG